MLGALLTWIGQTVFDEKLLDRVPDYLELVDVAFSRQGRGVIYVAKDGTRWFVGVKGRLHGPFEDVTWAPVISADGRRTVFVVRSDRVTRVFIDEAEVPAKYDGV